jgi:hypothetical protein
MRAATQKGVECRDLRQLVIASRRSAKVMPLDLLWLKKSG